MLSFRYVGNSDLKYKDGTSINELLVRDGFAKAKAYKPNIRYRGVFEAVEKEARAAGRGYWGSCVDGTDKTKRGGSGAGTGFDPKANKAATASSSTARPARTQAERKQQERLAAADKTTLTNPGDVKNCRDFASYEDAKKYYDLYFPQFGDVAKLDGDGDGKPCEKLLSRK